MSLSILSATFLTIAFIFCSLAAILYDKLRSHTIFIRKFTPKTAEPDEENQPLNCRKGFFRLAFVLSIPTAYLLTAIQTPNQQPISPQAEDLIPRFLIFWTLIWLLYFVIKFVVSRKGFFRLALVLSIPTAYLLTAIEPTAPTPTVLPMPSPRFLIFWTLIWLLYFVIKFVVKGFFYKSRS